MGERPEPVVTDELPDVAVLATLDDLVALTVVDASGRLVHASARWCELTGAPRDGALGRHWREFVHPDDLRRATALGRTAVASGREEHFQTRITRPDGEVLWIEATVAPVRNAEGAPTHWMMVAQDITERRAANEALERSERRLQVIFESSSDLITILEPDGRWRAISTSARRLLGYGDAPFPKGAPLSLVEPEDLPVVRKALDELRGQREGHSGPLFEHRMRTRDGRVVWLETSGVNLMEDPMVRGIVLHSRDVTDRHRAEAALRSTDQRLRSLVNHLFVAVVLADEAGEILYANEAASELFGVSGGPEALVGSSRAGHQDLARRLYADPAQAVARIGSIMTAGVPVLEERVAFRDGRELARSFVPIADETGSHGHVWLFRDLTEELAVAAEREYLLEIEREQNVRLQEIDALRADLIASVSHELRTPLTSIVSFTQLLRDGLGADPVERQAEFLDVIDRNTDRLLRLVEDLLLLDRLEANSLQLNVEPLDLPSLTEMAASSIAPVARRRGISVSVSSVDGPPLLGDVDRLGQLLDNLLVNAVKFSQRGGRVRLTCEPVGHRWRLTVRDEGIGIPADDVGRLFQRFSRASNARGSSTPGTGLGLVIALRIAELHDGTITIDSVEGAGTTVTVELSGAADLVRADSPLGVGAP